MGFFYNFLDTLQSILARIPSPFKSYIIPIESFKEQFKGIDATKLRKVRIRSTSTAVYAGVDAVYLVNPIKVIKCVDSKNNPHELINGPSIETRITMINGKRTIFFFDTLYMQNDAITGSGSRFIASFKKTIPLDTIKKIEVQNGRKGYRYVEN